MSNRDHSNTDVGLLLSVIAFILAIMVLYVFADLNDVPFPDAHIDHSSQP